MDFSSFIRADGQAMRQRDAFLLALSEKEGPAGRRLQESLQGLRSDDAAPPVPKGRVLQGATAVVIRYDFTLIYEAVSGDAFDERVLREVRDLEFRLRALPGWRRICGQLVFGRERYRCDPGQSFAAFTWPSHLPSNSTGRLFALDFDARGSEPLPTPAALAYLQRGQHPVHAAERYFPGDFEPVGSNRTGLEAPMPAGPDLLRSQFAFLLDITGAVAEGTTAAVQAAMAETKEEIRKLMADEVYPVVSQAGETLEHVRVRYFGDIISGLEVDRTLQGDLLWAVGSALFVAFALFLHTRSILLSAVSLILVFLSVPLAYVLTPAAKTTIASFLSLFLVAGIGSDVVFVYCDFWHQSAVVCQDLDKRVSWTLAHAGVNCLATSATTAASFLANLMSVLQPLREFGLFMGLCVMGSFLLMTLFLPPIFVLLALHENRHTAHRTAPAVVMQDEQVLNPVLPLPAPPEQVPVAKPRPKSCVGLVLLLALYGVESCPCVVVVCAGACSVAFALAAGLQAELDQGLPEVFPVGHNQFEVARLQRRFGSPELLSLGSRGPQSRGAACAPNVSLNQEASAEPCSLHWCSAAWPAAAKGSCWRSETRGSRSTWGTGDCKTLTVSVRASGSLKEEWEVAARNVMYQVAVGMQEAGSALEPLELPPLVFEHWSTGHVGTAPFHDLGSLNASGITNATASCQVDILCFAGPNTCSLPGWRDMGPVVLPQAAPRLLFPASSVPRHKRIDVTVLWGLRAQRSTPLVGPSEQPWSFDDTFDPADPWAQRAMYSFCEKQPEGLKVVKEGSSCWIEVLRWRLLMRGERFPTRDFAREAVDFYSSTVHAGEHLWYLDGLVRAAKLVFMVDVSKEAGSREILRYKELWDAFVGEQNGKAAVTANNAWHTAGAWVTAEAEVAVVDSTVSTILISALCGFGGMLAFTGDPVLALMVLLLVLGVISGLACFMVSMMGWKLGPIEVISLVVFVGYSVTYSLHIAHLYSEAGPESLEGGQILGPYAASGPAAVGTAHCDACGGAGCSFCQHLGRDHGPQDRLPELSLPGLRRVRTRTAVLKVGRATLSSAMSTIGSSFFLLFCTMRIFTKLGAVVIAVTMLSCVFALVSLPALLLVAGPGLRPWYKKCQVSPLPRLRTSLHLWFR